MFTYTYYDLFTSRTFLIRTFLMVYFVFFISCRKKTVLDY